MCALPHLRTRPLLAALPVVAMWRPSGAAADEKEEKLRSIGCFRTRDARFHLNVQLSATLSSPKLLFALAVAVLLLLYAWGGPGVSGAAPTAALRRKVRDLESALGKKVGWVLKHQKHLRNHFALPASLGSGGGGGGAGSERRLLDGGAASGWAPRVHEDGRRHLLTAPGGVSRLAEALAPRTQLAAFDDHYLCGDDGGGDMSADLEDEVVRKTIALAAVTWRAPLSLRNSMESWRRGGLLDLVDERMLFVNSPSDEDLAIAAQYEFDVYTTDEHEGNVMAGPALAYLVGNCSSDYVLMMEKDFVLSADRATAMRELFNGVQHLARGVDLYRLRGKTDHPAEGMPDCCEKPADPAAQPACPFYSAWKSGGYFSDHMNWLYIFCDPDILDTSNGRVAHCTSEPAAPDSYCFTSGESNWSNNPALFGRVWFDERLREVALRDFERNNMFEFNAMMSWLAWRPPAKICLSFQGIFKHVEIDQ